MSSLTIREAAPQEAAACRLLLAQDNPPQRFAGLSYLIATHAQNGSSSVAAAACFLRGQGRLIGVRLRVVKPYRRQGIGAAVLRHLQQLAEAEGLPRIFGVAWTRPDDPDPLPFAASLGFRRTLRITTVEGSVAHLAPYFAAIRDRLRASGRIPPDARVVRLADAPRHAVLQLVAEHLQHRQETGARVAATVDHARYDECPVVMVGDSVAGVLLWEVCTDHAEVPVRVVDPRWQGLWVNPLLLERASRHSVEYNRDRIRFEIPEGNADTQKLAARYRASIVSFQDHFEWEAV